MFSRLLNIALILMILTCPVRCMFGSCSCESKKCESVSTTTPCCCKTRSENKTPEPNRPGEPKEKCRCQCLCAGATLPDTFELDSPCQWQYHFDMSLQTIVQYQHPTLARCRGPDIPGELSTANVGRAICNLHCLLLI